MELGIVFVSVGEFELIGRGFVDGCRDAELVIGRRC